MENTIVHMDLDTFFVSVERLKNSALVGKPVIIGGLSDRGVVSSCSYEARKYGVRSAMPMKQARKLCPDALIIKGDMDEYSKYSRLVTEVVAEQAPLYEKPSVDEFYLDITGMDRFHGCLRWTQQLRQRIMNETGLPISFGLSVNKTVAKIATGEAKPNGELAVFKNQVKTFIYPLPIRKIPGLGEKMQERLRNMGINTVAQLAEMPAQYMLHVFGKNGQALWEKANGVYQSRVVPYTEQKSIGKEITFYQDTTDEQVLRETILSLTEKIGYELRRQGKLAGCISVKIRYANFDTHTHDHQITYTSADHDLMAQALKLFGKLHQRRMLIRLLGVRVSHLISGSPQLKLFEETEHLHNLYHAMDKIRVKYGGESVMRATGLRIIRSVTGELKGPKPAQEAEEETPTLQIPAKIGRGQLFGHRTAGVR